MAPPIYDQEYACIRGDDGRKYSVYRAKGSNKHANHGHGALFPENYAPRPGQSNSKWHCAIIGCDRAYKLLRSLGEHFTSDHQGDILHDLRDGNFRKIGNTGRHRPAYVALRSDNPPSPIPLPPPSPPKRSAADNSVASTAAARKATPGLYIKQEFSDDEGVRPKKISHIILNHESDEWVVSSPTPQLRQDRATHEDGHRSNEGGDSSEDADSDEDEPVSTGGRLDDDDDFSKSEDTDHEKKTQQTNEERILNTHNDKAGAQNHSAEIWAYLNSLTPQPLTIPDDPCIKKLTKLPRLRELPQSWKVRLNKRVWMEKYCHLKTITAIVHFLVGEDRDWKVCKGLGCDTLHNGRLMKTLHNFAMDSEAFNGEYAFPRCIMLPDDVLMGSEAVMERIGLNQCVNSYYRRGKKVPFPGSIFARRLELPHTPNNRGGNNRPYRESSALRREGRLLSLPLSGATVTPSRSPKRKASCPQYEDELPSYRPADPSSPNQRAPWEEFTGFLPLRSSPPRGGLHSSQLGSVMDIMMIAHSTTHLAAQPQKRIRLVDNSGLGRGDFTVLTLAAKDDVHFMNSEQGGGRMLNCSVAKGKVDVRVVVRGRGQASEELRFSVSEDTQWVVKEGWECEVRKFEGTEGVAKVHVTGLGVGEGSQE